MQYVTHSTGLFPFIDANYPEDDLEQSPYYLERTGAFRGPSELLMVCRMDGSSETMFVDADFIDEQIKLGKWKALDEKPF